MPLTPRELGYVLGIELDRLLQVLEPLHSVLLVPETPDAGPVTSFHGSLQDFLISKDRSGIYFINRQLKHTYLAQCCLKHLCAAFPVSRDFAHCRSAVAEHLRQSDKSRWYALQYA